MIWNTIKIFKNFIDWYERTLQAIFKNDTSINGCNRMVAHLSMQTLTSHICHGDTLVLCV